MRLQSLSIDPVPSRTAIILYEPSAGLCAVARERIAEPFPERARHLEPIWRALALHDVAFATVLQNEGRFTIPSGRPAVAIIGDDLYEAKGPRVFSAR